MQINGLLYQEAKFSVGTRSARKRGSKKPGGTRATTRIKLKYQELLAVQQKKLFDLTQQVTDVGEIN